MAAIRSFFRFLQHRDPAAIDKVRRVLAIPFKKTDTRLVPYLVKEEMQALLDAPDPSTREGIRDRAMLHLAVCAGLRLGATDGQERRAFVLSLHDLRRQALQLEAMIDALRPADSSFEPQAA